VAKEPIPGSIKHPLSVDADWANPYLYGGTAAIVGIVGLVAGGVIALFGNLTSGAILAGLGAILIAAGFFIARRGT
jgi:hypothetical protein